MASTDNNQSNVDMSSYAKMLNQRVGRGIRPMTVADQIVGVSPMEPILLFSARREMHRIMNELVKL